MFIEQNGTFDSSLNEQTILFLVYVNDDAK